MGKQEQERRAYPQEFKDEAAAPARRQEKPVRQVAADVGINENMLYRWMQQARTAAGPAYRPFRGTDGRGTRSLPACGRKTMRCGRRCEAPLHSKS
jgi:transposase-like protein